MENILDSVMTRKIYSVISNLGQLPKVRTTFSHHNSDKFINEIYIANEQVYVPDFKFVWCTNKKHYRVYICVGSTIRDKVNAGYCICTIKNGLAAIGFSTLYSFLHKHRANNKSDAD